MKTNKLFKGVVASIGRGTVDGSKNGLDRVHTVSQILLQDGTRITGPIRISSQLMDILREGNEVEFKLVKPTAFYPLTLASLRVTQTNEIFKSKDNLGIDMAALLFLAFILSLPLGLVTFVTMNSFLFGFIALLALAITHVVKVMARWRKNKNWFLAEQI